MRVLDRIEKRDRQEGRARRKISKALQKKQKPSRGIQAVRKCSLSSIAFAPKADIIGHKNTAASMRRINRKREGGKRVFYVGEVLQGFEEIAALIVAPADKSASAALLAQTITSHKSELSIKFTVSQARVLLVESTGSTAIETGSQHGDRVYARKIHFEDGQFVFYLTAEGSGEHAPPWALGIDCAIYQRLQNAACSMFGLSTEC